MEDKAVVSSRMKIPRNTRTVLYFEDNSMY